MPGAMIGSSVIGAMSSLYAGKKQADAAKKAAATQLEMYNTSQGNLKPFMDTGKGAVYSLAQLYGLPTEQNPSGGQPFGPEAMNKFRASPDFAFAEEQGMRGLQRSQAGKNGLINGGAFRELATFNSGLATQNFGNYFQRLFQLSQLGSGAASAGAQTGAQFGNNIGNSYLAQGQAEASGAVGASNALTGGMNQLAMYNLMSGRNPSSYGSQPSTMMSSVGGGMPAPQGSLPYVNFG